MTPLLSEFLKKQRFNSVQPYIQGDILDLGCSTGGIITLLKPGQNYMGVDGNSTWVHWLRKNYSLYEFCQRDFDTELLSLENKQFDTILMLAIIEHLKNPDKILAQIPQYLRSNGKLLITTPSPLGDKIHRFGARLGLFYMSAVEDHEIIFSYTMLKKRLVRNGLDVVYYRKFLLGGNQLFICETHK